MREEMWLAKRIEVPFARVLWRMERRVAKVAASVLEGGIMPVDAGLALALASWLVSEVVEVEEMTFRDCRTAREDRRLAIVDAKAWMES